MYTLLKKLGKSLIPAALQQQLRLQVARRVYAGNAHYCVLCKTELSRFVDAGVGTTICPACGSLPRHRRLWHLLTSFFPLRGKMLHFSPPACLQPKLKALSELQYITTDFEHEFQADERYDITNMTVADNHFDYIVCYHVLEHIPEDRKAMRELYRVLKPGGTLFVQTPFRQGETYEDPTIITPEGRLQHFGQEDHVRVYGLQDLEKRLSDTGFKTELKVFREATLSEKWKREGLKLEEYILLATKHI